MQLVSTSTSKLAYGLLLMGCLFITPQVIWAQGKPGQFAIGLQVGEPSGLSIASQRSQKLTLDFLAAWDLDQFFYLNVHGLYRESLANDPKVDLFFGPGGFVGFFEDNSEFDLRIGISGTVGVSFLFDPIELYLRVTPRLQVIDETDADIGGGLGVRWWL